jgi:DNA-binding GntR family transcriptional regulator
LSLKLKVPDIGATPSASIIISRYLREAIISGDLAENEPIRQDQIATMFNVSKIPVREALKTLEAEGLVVFYRNRGAVVAAISEPELAQMFEVRILLESSILRLSVPNMTEKDFKKIAVACDRFIMEDDASRWAELNWELHLSMYEAANRPFMVNMIKSIHDKLERYLRVQLTVSDGLIQADKEHRKILEACKKRDADGAAELMKKHIAGVCQDLYAHLPGFGSTEVSSATAKGR